MYVFANRMHPVHCDVQDYSNAVRISRGRIARTPTKRKTPNKRVSRERHNIFVITTITETIEITELIIITVLIIIIIIANAVGVVEKCSAGCRRPRV